MGVLANRRHELFAQGLAKGRSQEDAYMEAGYKPSRPHASRLATDGNVQARVAELQERASVKVEITVADLTKRLLAIAAKGEVASDAPLLGVARAALMDAAKLNGLVTEKSETTHKRFADRPTKASETAERDEWREEFAPANAA